MLVWLGMMAEGFPLSRAEVDGNSASTGEQGCCKQCPPCFSSQSRGGKTYHTAADRNPSSRQNGALCLPAVREEVGVLWGLAAKGKVTYE